MKNLRKTGTFFLLTTLIVTQISCSDEIQKTVKTDGAVVVNRVSGVANKVFDKVKKFGSGVKQNLGNVIEGKTETGFNENGDYIERKVNGISSKVKNCASKVKNWTSEAFLFVKEKTYDQMTKENTKSALDWTKDKKDIAVAWIKKHPWISAGILSSCVLTVTVGAILCKKVKNSKGEKDKQKTRIA